LRALRILNQQLERVAGGRVADFVEIHLQAGQRLLAVLGEIAGQRQQDADLDRVGCPHRKARRGDHQRGDAHRGNGAQRVAAWRLFVRAPRGRRVERHRVFGHHGASPCRCRETRVRHAVSRREIFALFFERRALNLTF
jgi:hypothetical protein